MTDILAIGELLAEIMAERIRQPPRTLSERSAGNIRRGA